MENVLIGAPIYKRDWILPYWLKAIERQNYPLTNIGFVFELGPDDDATHDLLYEFHEKHPELLVYQGDIQCHMNHQTHEEGERTWNEIRYLTMAELRNNLLNKACALQDQFDYYLSLDSDILIKDPDMIFKLINYSKQYPDTVISPLSYMTPDGTAFPSVMTWREGRRYISAGRDLENYPIGQPFIADVVMAVVLMPKSIFTQARYRGHRQGEDLGFAVDIGLRGFKSLAASDIYCPHVMHRSMLETHAKNWLDVD